MDFFEQQHRARRHTWLMLLLFVLAVAAIVAAFDLVCAVVYIWLFDVQILYSSNLLQQVPRSVYLWSTLATLLVIGWGTASRLYQLSSGGVAVADLIGARHVKRDTGEPAERRLLNVVEEMALASGITVPLVFVMDDQRTINAFAAGYSPNEATVIVTRGTLEQLNRRAAGGRGARVQPHPERRHASQYSPRRGDRRYRDGRVDRSLPDDGDPRRRRPASRGNGHPCVLPRAPPVADRLDRRAGGPADQGGDLPRARVPRRCVRGAVHPQSGRHRGSLVQDRPARQHHRAASRGGAFPYVHRRPRQRLFRVCLVSRSSAAR